MIKLRKISVAILTIVILTVVSAMLVGLTGHLVYKKYAMEKRVELKTLGENLVQQAAEGLAIPLWNFDHKQIERITESLLNDKHVYAITLHQSLDHKEILTLKRDQEWKIVNSDQPVVDEGFITKEHPVKFSEEIIGTVKVYITPKFLEERLISIRNWIIYAITSMVIIVIITQFLLLWGLVLKPIGLLDRYACIAPGGDNTATPSLTSPFFGELENLRSSISSMVWLLNTRLESLEAEVNRSRSSEALFHTLIQTIPDLIWLKDVNGIYMTCNTRFGLFAGISEELIRGKSDYDFFDKEAADLFRMYDQKVMETGEQSINEEPLFFSWEGRTALCETIKVPMKDAEGKIIGVLGISREITERVKASEDLRASEERLKDAQRIARLGSWVLNLADNNLSWSDEVFHIFEIDPNKFGATYEAFLNAIHPDDREAVNRAYLSSLDTRIPYDIVHRLLMPDGRIKYINERCYTEFNEEDVPAQSVGTIQEITDRILAEKELENYRTNLEEIIEEKTRELNLSNKELFTSNEELSRERERLIELLKKLQEAQNQLVQAEKMASLGLLSAGIAHEINNPLNYIHGGIMGIENFIKDHHPEYPNELNLLFNAVHVGVKRVTEIVSSLNNYSRQDDETKTVCDIHTIIDNCLIMLQFQMKNKIKVIKKYSTETALVVCNEGKLHQAFLNVIVNAIQAIEDSGIITIQTKSMADHFVVSISDNGKGISEENVQKIFDPFFTTKPIGKGTGLGLSISYNIIKEHNGRIECESALGIGTKFTFIVPTKEGIMV